MTTAALPLQQKEKQRFRSPGDYSLVGLPARKAIEKGLAEANWYQCKVPREQMRGLLERRNGPAIRDTLIWFGLIFGFGAASWMLWGTWWFLLPYAGYAVLYASTSDSRWHESSHGTAFRTDWMNNALYEVASFMVMRESVVWRWSHNRHHSDTIILGRDPEIVVQRPPNLFRLVLSFTAIEVYPNYFSRILLHSRGKMAEDEKAFIPESEFAKVFVRARIYVAIYAAVLGLSIALGSVLPLLYVGLANLFGSWLMPIYGYTQHAGLAENVLDHRLNCRTVNMSLIHRFLYWNMNYHVEHHMFPLVPYHALPKLHDAVREDMPTPYQSLWSAWREIIPAVIRQSQDPTYFVERELPDALPGQGNETLRSDEEPDAEGWVEVAARERLQTGEPLRFDHGKKTYALFRDDSGCLFATDGVCTHGNAHLADGLMLGKTIECPKHNGRFHLEDGAPVRAPVCQALATYPLEVRNDRLHLNVLKPGGEGAREVKTQTLQVAEERFLTPFIKELVLEPLTGEEGLEFKAGDYLQVNIPEFDELWLTEMELTGEQRELWEKARVFQAPLVHDGVGRKNNYSLASNPQTENRRLRLNVRLATPPEGVDCAPGIGSSYLFSLKPGSTVEVSGPHGDFHIKPTSREMVYIGGGAGMAPIRAHLSQLFENEDTARKVRFFYGARSRKDLFYEELYRDLARTKTNFQFDVVLSEASPEDEWVGPLGFVHEEVESYLRSHPSPQEIEFYLCGPPPMIRACSEMLDRFGVPGERIAFDEF